MKLHHTVISTQPHQLHKITGNREKEKWGVKVWVVGGSTQTYRHFVSHQGVGVHDGDKLVEKVGLGDEELWGQFLHHSLQLLGGIPWNSVPGLWLTPKAVKAEQSQKTHGIYFSSFSQKSISKYQCKQNGSPVSIFNILLCKAMFKLKKYHQVSPEI